MTKWKIFTKDDTKSRYDESGGGEGRERRREEVRRWKKLPLLSAFPSPPLSLHHKGRKSCSWRQSHLMHSDKWHLYSPWHCVRILTFGLGYASGYSHHVHLFFSYIFLSICFCYFPSSPPPSPLPPPPPPPPPPSSPTVIKVQIQVSSIITGNSWC